MFRIGVMKAVLVAAIATTMFAGSASAAGKKPFFEKGIERWGSDYSIFEVSSGGANTCYQACVKDKKCLAWTYHRPGTKGKNGECHLKSKVPHASNNVCCVSGVMVGQSSVSSKSYTPAAASHYKPEKRVEKNAERSLTARIAGRFFKPANLDEGADLGLPELKPAAAAPPLKITPVSFVSSEEL